MADISKITLPSGNTYNIKDSVARQMISGGVSFIIAWDGTSAPVAADIPSGVKVTYNDTIYTGTLVATADTIGAFYLVKSSSTPGGETLDIYDEYVTVSQGGDPAVYFWEKLGDTKLDLSDVVTGVALNKNTDTVIGTNSTFTITQPTVALSTEATASAGSVSVVSDITSASVSGDDVTVITGLGTPSTKSAIGANSTFKITQPTVSLETDATAGTGVISLATDASGTTKYLGATASNGNVDWDSKDTVTVITGLGAPTTGNAVGKDATFNVTQPTVSMSLTDSTATGKVGVLTGVSANKTNVKATASGANTVWKSKDEKTVVTGYSSPSSDTFLKSISTTTKKLATTTVTGVSGSTTASKVTRASQTTSKGTGTASTLNTEWLKGVSVSDETLIIGAVTMDTQTTYSVSATTDVTVPVAAASATQVATGAVAATDTHGATVVTSATNGTSTTALTGLGDPTTDSVIGAASTFTITQPTIALATGATAGTGVISVATDASGTTKYIGGSASGANVAWKDQKTVSAVTGYASPTTDTVIGDGATFTVTQPTITATLADSASTGKVGVVTEVNATTTNVKATASGANTTWNSKDAVTAVTGYAAPTTDTVVGTESTITVTPSKTNIKATASGANTEWNSKDTVTVLTDGTDVQVTKGN